VEVRILGPTEVVDGAAPVPLPTGRARFLLGLLVLNAREVVSADRLVDELWGESPPPTVNTSLQGLVYKLRSCLEPQRAKGEPPTILLTRPPGYLLDLAPEQIDSSRFRRMVAEAAGAPPQSAVELLRRALALWRGPALVDFLYEPFAQAEIAELEELRLTAVEKRIEADLALGRHRDLIGELERLAAEHPLREGVHGLLMLALYRSGRQAEALRVYADLRSTLVDQMGVDPGPSLQQLEELILRQDPILDLEVVTPSEPVTDEERWIPEERRIVTVLAVDVAMTSDKGDAPDAEVSQRVLERYFRRATAVVAGHGGSVEGTVGDTLVGIFGLPATREDDALRAVRAAVDLRHLLAATNAELGETGNARLTSRVGIETGEVIVGETTVSPSGSPVRGATQLYRVAQGSEILIGEATRLFVGKAVLAEPRKVDIDDGPNRAAWKVTDLTPGHSALPLTMEAPMVDREAELSELRAAYGRVVGEGKPFRLTTIGEPGIGKSRIARELASMIESEAWVLTGHCPAYGEGNTFWPLREVVEAAAGGVETGALLDLLQDEEDAEQIAKHVMAITGSAEWEGSLGALFPMMRRFFEALARERPVVLILEDLHWAQSTFLDLVEYLTERIQAPLFLLCLARPELLEEHAEWVESDRTMSVVLGPLGAEESRRLAANRLAGRMVPGEVLTRVLGSAQGNPLFVEQLVATIGEEGDFSIPATVQALLAARIDRLGPAERDLIRSASVLGHRFSADALISLLPEPARRHAARHLRTLERKDLMVRGPDPEQGDSGFRHVLIQQAAYRSMTMQARAKLHERAADWLEAESAGEFDETVGYHLERAYRYRQELGFLDNHTQGLAIRAGEKLAGAGLRVFTTRLDAAGAESLLSRARRLLPSEHPSQWEVSFRLAEAHEVMGRHDEADLVLSEILATEPQASSSRIVVELERVRVRFATGPDPMTLEEIADLATAALTGYEANGDEAGMAQALFMLGEVSIRRGRIAEMEEVVRRGMGHADRSDSGREQLGARRMLATALEVGPKPVPGCIEECEELARWRGKNNAAVLVILAHLNAMNGQFDRARDMVARAEVLFKERARARRPLALLGKRRAEVEALAGDLDSAEDELRRALQLDLDMEIREEASEAAALLARVLFEKGNLDEAAGMADLSRDQAPSQSVAPQALWRSTRALTMAARGEYEDATRLAESAVDLIPGAMLNLRADIHIDLAMALSTLGFREAAQGALDKAIDLYGRKGNLVAASQARSRIAI
jgi:DNA-binding SARP family transcriptional activator/tetratricopeptide (TPR) repeat protein